MRIAILADIHGNREAFDACMAHIARHGVDRYVLLGDIVGYGADPSYLVDRLARMTEEGAIALKGNHDEAAALEIASGMNEYASQAIQWTARQLDRAQRELLGSLPFSAEEDDLLFVHSEASTPSDWVYVTDSECAQRSLNATAQRVTFCGHVHVPQLYNMPRQKPAQSFVPQAGTPIPLIGQRKWLAVMGSVGQPRDRNPAAAYAILDTAKRELTYWRVPYDMETAAGKIHAAGLPQMLAARLFIGR